MANTLAEIINTALSETEKGVKLASARDASPAAGLDDFLAEELPTPKVKTAHDEAHETPAEEAKEREERKKKEHEKKAAPDVFSDAQFAIKCAEALEMGAAVLSSKLATGDALHAPGPHVMEGEFHTATTTSPKPQGNGVTDRVEGHTPQPAGLPNTKKDFTSVKDESGHPHNHPGKTAGEDWTKDKVAAARFLRAKIAEAEVLMNLGQIAAAEKLYGEVKEAHAKLAQDPSSPPPTLPGHNASFKLDVEPGPSTHIPDNKGLIDITKAQAKDPTTREVTQHFTGTPKKDNAVPAHTLRTDGQKLSAADLVLPTKVAAEAKPVQPGKDPKVTPAYDAGVTRSGGSPDSGNKKTAQVDPAVARAYLERVIKTASDPDASAEERAKAASTIKAIKDKHGVDVDALLQA